MSSINNEIIKFARNYYLSILVIGLLLLLYLPVNIWLVKEWLYNPFYGHGFLVLTVALVIIWLRRKQFTIASPSIPGLLTILAGLVLYFVSYIIWGHYFLAAISLIIVIMGTIIFFFGFQVFRRFFFPIAYMVLMVPLPGIDWLSLLLQRSTTIASIWLGRIFGLDVHGVGNQITLPNAQFYIDIPCSGVNSMLATLAISAVIAFLLVERESLWKNMLLFFSAIPFALIGNIIRVTLIFLIAEKLGQQTALEYFHSISSPISFVLTFLLIIGLTAILRLKFRELREVIYG